MDMDEQLLPQLRWCLQVQVGEGIRIIPRDNEALCVTDVFLVDPESADGLGVVAAYAEMGTRKLMLAELSSEVTDVELPTPEVMDEEFCFYVMRQGADSDADNDAGVVAVQFEGFVRSLPSSDTNEELEVEEDGDEDEDAASSDDDDDRIEEDNSEDGETDGEADHDVARASSSGGNTNTKDVGKVAARAFLALFLFSYIAAFFRLVM
jgi:hypothetical protein